MEVLRYVVLTILLLMVSGIPIGILLFMEMSSGMKDRKLRYLAEDVSKTRLDIYQESLSESILDIKTSKDHVNGIRTVKNF
jgi:hypothetical protein